MALIVSVPLNTMLADLDESLAHAAASASSAATASTASRSPSTRRPRDWSRQLTAPTVNLFLYDLRESRAPARRRGASERGNGRRAELRPPLSVECSYAVTAWTRPSRTSTACSRRCWRSSSPIPTLPDDALAGAARADGAQRFADRRRASAQPKADGKADFWTAVGGQYKASLDYVVHALLRVRASPYERGPEVRTQTMRVGDLDGGRTAVARDAPQRRAPCATPTARPLADAWVALPDARRCGPRPTPTAASRFGRVPAGQHAVVARGGRRPRGRGDARRARRRARPRRSRRAAPPAGARPDRRACPAAPRTAPGPLARGPAPPAKLRPWPSMTPARPRVLLGDLGPMVRARHDRRARRGRHRGDRR